MVDEDLARVFETELAAQRYTLEGWNNNRR